MDLSALRAALLPLLALLFAMGSFPLGATLAKSIFPQVGPAGATVLRLSLAAVMLCLGLRAWRARLAPQAWWQVARYGAVLGLMNLCFYVSLTRLPLGIAVALEFTGPLSVALWHARRAVDFVWIALAVLGLALLLPLRASAAHLDPLGALFALGAGMFWAAYIIWGRAAGLAAGRWTVALGSLVGAVVVLPFGMQAVLPALHAPAVLGIGFVVALLSSAIPYSLEMWALTRLPPRVFGVSMSLEPALAALAGWLFLAEQLAPAQYFAIAAVIIACGGTALTSRMP